MGGKLVAVVAVLGLLSGCGSTHYQVSMALDGPTGAATQCARDCATVNYDNAAKRIKCYRTCPGARTAKGVCKPYDTPPHYLSSSPLPEVLCESMKKEEPHTALAVVVVVVGLAVGLIWALDTMAEHR